MSNILEKASELVNGDRAKDYGPAEVNHQRIAELWSAYLEHTAHRKAVTDPLIDKTDAAVMMLLVKIARLCETPQHEDTWVDIAGYAQVGYWCANPRELET